MFCMLSEVASEIRKCQGLLNTLTTPIVCCGTHCELLGVVEQLLIANIK